MDNTILDLLEPSVRKWIDGLTPEDIAKLLHTMYHIPDIRYLYSPIVYEKQISVNGISNASVELGRCGEDMFEQMCKNLPVNYKVINVSKTSYMGDFIIEYTKSGRVYKCLVDIKNYKNTVPSKEINKFVKDINYGAYDAGLIISYKSRFIGISGSIYVDMQCLPHGRIPVMYVSKVSEDVILQCVQLLCNKLVMDTHYQINMSKLRASITFINTAISQVSYTRRILNNLQSNTATQIQQCQEHLIGCEYSVKTALQQMENDIIGGAVEETAETTTEVNNAIENKPDVKTSALSLSNDIQFLEQFKPQDRVYIKHLLKLPWRKISYTPRVIFCHLIDDVEIVLTLKPYTTKTTLECGHEILQHTSSANVDRFLKLFKKKSKTLELVITENNLSLLKLDYIK